MFNLEGNERVVGCSPEANNLDLDTGETAATVSAESAQMSTSELRRKQAALFILKTSEVHRLSLATMESLLPDISTLVEHAALRIQTRLLDALSSEPAINESVIRSICQDEEITSPFVGMETTYQHMQYFRDCFNMIVSRLYAYHH